MARLPRPRRQPIQWARIYRQTLTLIHKNFLVFYASPISTLVRALILPLIFTAVLCSLKYLRLTSGYDNRDWGISKDSFRVRDLAVAMDGIERSKLVFVANGTSSALLDPLVGGIKGLPGMSRMEVVSVEKPGDLFDACKQSVVGRSECYAAVIFTAFDEKIVDYRVVMDEYFAYSWSWGSWRGGNDMLSSYIYPLQWAINSQVGAISDTLRPSTQTWDGFFGPNLSTAWMSTPSIQGGAAFWMSMVSLFVGPVFVLILLGVVYHEATFVAVERESSVAELMSSQEVTIVPRILSTFLSFYALYLPGFIACSIIMTQVLFVMTSDILLILLTILAGASFITSSHFLGSFFGKANLAGLYSSTLTFALALVTISATMTITEPTVQITALALVFPPYTWATLIEDIALREMSKKAFSLTPLAKESGEVNKVQYMDGSLYIIFFFVQTIAYALGTYLVEKHLWGVKRNFERIEASSDVAVRCTELKKTYYGKAKWYWPFSKGDPVVAVNNLDLEIKKGSVTFLLGPNGGGKTTTLKCIAGMTAMDAGSRLEINEDGLVFGICPQNNVFWRGLTVQQHIKIWSKLKTAAAPDTEEDDVIAECDLLEKVDAVASTLSGGQMRKLQLAIAFCGGSKVCFIDEASSGLDPLSRRAIWNIIQKGHARRTVLITTHFLDEADVLANHIAIVYKGKLVCEGPATTLKAQFGDNYLIRNNKGDEEDGSMVWRTSNSAEATRKLLELESHDNDLTYDVVFPTLEQVFLKVTSDTAIHASGGDGFVGELETTTVLEEKIFALEAEHRQDIDLDVGSGTGFIRQVQALFTKRYILLTQKNGWIAYLINLIIPIIIAAAIAKFLRRFKSMQTCEMTMKTLRDPVYSNDNQQISRIHPVLTSGSSPQFYISERTPLAILGPESAWSSEAQESLYVSTIGPLIYDPSSVSYTDVGGFSTPNEANQTYLNEMALTSREFVSTIDEVVRQISNYSGNGFYGFGVWAPSQEAPTIFHDNAERIYESQNLVTVFNLVTNRIAGASSSTGSARAVSADLFAMSHPVTSTDFRNLPIAILLALAFLAATSIAVIYPAYERLNNVRSLHYCNGVSPAALWLAYLLFDTQFIIIQSIVVWAAIYAGDVSRLYYESGYLLGVFILFGIATYLGTYLVSLFVKKAAFAIATGVHILLLVLYLISYVFTESFGNMDTRHATYEMLQYGLGLSSPSANLLRGLMLAANAFGILCGQYGDNDVSNPMGYARYGSVYVNLLIQIVFLGGCLAAYEYGSADFIRRNITNRGTPNRLHYRVEAGGEPSAAPIESEKNASAVTNNNEILKVSSVSKYFGKTFAVENVSFNISSNETLALLGGNGAGKTTVINMIRGSLLPNFGDILLDGTSVLRNPSKARLQMGVCPQDDAVDNLTMKQTLRFYATVKGLKNIDGNVEKVLNALNITSYQDLPVKALSGGTKRKLSVAIALLGNPRVLLLDEPSTGQDAGAKRILWKALQDISANRAILLTTHSMEEAEKLATNVAIMGTKMLATGSLSSLQERHGGTFMVRAVRAEGTDAEDVSRHVERIFEGSVKDYQDSHGQVTFGLPHDKAALGAIMRKMEELKGDRIEQATEGGAAGGSSSAGGSSAAVVKERSVRCFSDYTINGPTLEEVFMNVARESGVAGGV